ncbi:hypothetical protein [Aeromonas bivalvium]|uniref:hypothetical protein n=1 Tax=Aeromonas bivalvium TaxID=440079 RepID=UPI003D20E81C
MKRVVILISVCLMGVGVAHGATMTAQQQCEAQAAEKKLAGAARSSFVQKCVREAPAGAMAGQCEQAATAKKLAGAARNSFIQKCVRDGAADKTSQCEQAATAKKLAGAARNSFIQKCVKTG